MLADAVRSVWSEPRVAEPPRRVWRDWLLVAVLVPAALLESVLGDDVAWPVVALVIALVAIASLLWRRTHPLAMVSLGFGSVILVDLVSLAGPRESIGLYATACLLVLPYALFRWGSGRDMAVGLAIMLVAAVLGISLDFTGVGDAIGGFIALLFPAALGASIRFRTVSRLREVDRVRLQEREQFARELHDTVAHHVSAIAIRAQAGRLVAASDPAAASGALEVIEEEASRTLTEMRVMVGALRQDEPADLAPQRGIPDIERIAAIATGTPRVTVSTSGDLDGLRPSVEAALYRLAQESITNALRHARNAGLVEVVLAGDADQVHLVVRDDGEVVPAGRTAAGYGLLGMRERVSLLDGTLTAGPGHTGGWAVDVVLPRRGG